MDSVFKDNYKVFMFSLLPRVEPNWHLQVKNLSELWKAAGDLIERAQFYLAFTSDCFQLELPFEDYNIEEAFEKANNEWTEELMVLVADMILKWYDDAIPPKAEIVTLEKGQIQINSAICRRYASRDQSL